METAIVALQEDPDGEWVARFACGHSQHVRHRPPWTERAWVTTPEGRRERIGAAIDCSLCDRIAIPEGAREYKRTAVFTEVTLPAGLSADHRTRAGTWARIVVEEGALDYHVRARLHRLGPGRTGIVEPEVPHHVVPVGAVRFHVEFWRVPSTSG